MKFDAFGQGLCDAAFHGAFPSELPNPEALVIAAGVCCRFLPGGDCVGLGPVSDGVPLLVEAICGSDNLLPFISFACGV